MHSSTRRLWLPEEDRIVVRYARALAAGRYQHQRAAAIACLVDLGRLYEHIRKSAPSHHVAAKGRDTRVVERRLREFLRQQGLTWSGAGLMEAERKAVRRYARGLAFGRFPDARRAAEACLDEMRRLPPGSRPTRPRSLHTIHCHVLDEAHRIRRPWARSRWSHEEDEIARRFGGALARGKYANAEEAAAACRRELARLLGRSAASGRPTVAVKVRLTRWAHRAGWARFHAPWSDQESAVLDNYLRALHEGRYANVSSAARDCVRELALLHSRMCRRSPMRYGQTRPRTTYATLRELARRATCLNLPRLHARWTKAETDVAVKYARAVDSGQFPSWNAATRPCMAELGRLYAVAGRRSPIRARRLAGRGLTSVHWMIGTVAHRLGLRGPERPRAWSPEEGRVFEQWLHWYDRYRSAGRSRSALGTAASGLQEELEEKGFRRTVVACRARLKDGWLLLHGLALPARHASRISERRLRRGMTPASDAGNHKPKSQTPKPAVGGNARLQTLNTRTE